MKVYADASRLRTEQILRDLAVGLWVVVWVRLGFLVNRLFDDLAGPGERVERAGSRFAETLSDVSRAIGRVPFVGGTLEEPFESAAEAGRVLEQAGAVQQEVAHSLALWLAVLIAIVPISLVLLRHLPGRIRWAREATAAQRLTIDAADLHVFALRALATRPLHELRRAAPDPAGAFAAGRYEELAALELKALGLGAVSVRDR